MGKKKLRKIAYVLAFVALLVSITPVLLFAPGDYHWINCKDVYPGICPFGGCVNPEYATECYLRNCGRSGILQVKCGGYGRPG